MENKNSNERLKALRAARLDAWDGMADIFDSHLRLNVFFANCAFQAWLGNLPLEVDEDIFPDMFMTLGEMLEKDVQDFIEQRKRYIDADSQIKELERSES